jgi:hypothetical protein
MADAYLSFSLAVDGGPLPSSLPTPEDAVLEETRDVLVVDMFGADFFHYPSSPSFGMLR